MKTSIPWGTLPRWHVPEANSEDSSSRDPLGFQRYTSLFADQLLPNITVLTRRARYYSYICWSIYQVKAIFEVQRTAGDDLSNDECAMIYSRFERYLALAELLYHEKRPKSGCSWIGMQGAKGVLKKYPAKPRLDLPLSKDEGSIGIIADYFQSMVKLGFLDDQSDSGGYVLTDKGKLLAQAFTESSKESNGGAHQIAASCCDLSVDSIDRGKLVRAGRWMCLSNIGPREKRILEPLLLGGEHKPIVQELKTHLDRRRKEAESSILRKYIPGRNHTPVAFTLHQNAVHQLFALASLSIFKGLISGIPEKSDRVAFNLIIANQLKKEHVKTGRLADMTKGIKWDEEITKIQEGDETGDWAVSSIRLLDYVRRAIDLEPALVLTEDVESVSLRAVLSILQKSDLAPATILNEIGQVLLQAHVRVHESKHKCSWVHLEGSYLVRDSDPGTVSLSFPPNTIRLRSLLSLYRDLGN